MEKNLVYKIRENKEQPLIAIIGATVPTREYERRFGVEVGFLLRQHIESRRGTLFTGGVSGVGVDVYAGIMQYCVDELRKQQINKKMPDDRFFVLVPGNDCITFRKDLNLKEPEYESVPFEVPEAYHALGLISERRKLDVVAAGNDLGERRAYLSQVADILIAVNGGMGTLDEALNAIENGKSVIALSYSGGAASMLHSIKDPSKVKKFKPKDIVSISRIRQDVNPNLIYVASDTQEMIQHLNSLLR